MLGVKSQKISQGKHGNDPVTHRQITVIGPAVGTEPASQTTPTTAAPVVPHPSEVDPGPPCPPPPGFQLLRKLLHLGNSYAVTIPTRWVRAQVNPRLPYVTTTPNPDGSITLRPFNPARQTATP